MVADEVVEHLEVKLAVVVPHGELPHNSNINSNKGLHRPYLLTSSNGLVKCLVNRAALIGSETSSAAKRRKPTKEQHELLKPMLLTTSNKSFTRMSHILWLPPSLTWTISQIWSQVNSPHLDLLGCRLPVRRKGDLVSILILGLGWEEFPS